MTVIKYEDTKSMAAIHSVDFHLLMQQFNDIVQLPIMKLPGVQKQHRSDLALATHLSEKKHE